MKKEIKETALTTRQEKILKTVIIRNLTDKVQEYLNDKAVAKTFPIITDMTEAIIVEFNESNLMDKANEQIRKGVEEEGQISVDCCE